MDKQIEIKNGTVMPMIPTRDLVVFPGMSVNFDVGREMSVQSLQNARNDFSGDVFLCAQKDVNVESPEKSDMYKVGTVANIRQVIKSPGGVCRCMVRGVRKAKLVDMIVHDDCYEAVIKPMPNYSKDKLYAHELDAVEREVRKAFEEYSQLMPKMPQEIYNAVMGSKSAEDLFEAVAFNVPLAFNDRQSLLESPSAGEKLVLLMTILAREIDVLSLERDIHEQVQNQIEDNQREYYIREQIKALQNELGEGSLDGSDEGEIQRYYEKITEMQASDEIKEKLNEEVKRLSRMAGSSAEAVVIRGYLDTVLGLPWGVYTKDTTDIKKAQNVLDKDHYGLKRVKERILENLAVRQLTPDIKGQIICLVGPPGVGKTSVAKSVARALDKKFVRVSLGGVRDESDIRGHRKTYIGAMPGRIINGMKIAGSSNPVMLLDEIDKMSNDFRGDPSAAMLEVLDSEQNNAFRDHYLEVPYDLSDVLFITTANTLDTVAGPLRDRMEIIELSSYTREEKFNIAKKHLLKKQLEKHGLTSSMMRITNDGLYMLIDGYTREAGVRTLERNIGSLCRKAAKEIIEKDVSKVTFSAKNIPDYLGHIKFLDDDADKEDRVGYVNGMAWTSVGGVLLPLEVLVMDGKGALELTGSLGDVMKESARIAVSYCRSIADEYGIQKDFHEKKDLHIHAPEGAVPKDGPSAGVTMITALVSALSGIKVRGDLAMTGEITLTGRVLPIGGLREKTMAAYKAGMKTVVVPEKNRGDLDEVEDIVKENVEFVFAKTIDDVLRAALVKPPQAEVMPEMMPEVLPVKRRGRARKTV
ncbi:endopeptidase La [Ruminococcus albus]|uniref:Lon protease n=1 Tax=Ruminococcus albus 8 TaxID=246199 RepID=E9SD47_RUMAL|nr:endopeptidase La [Ruminococcus albus]EGC02777.1 endopeptidase La [Ruminococcus albus 8]MCC3352148.1 endopeptidase La [Ruminococcus albus 8]